MEAAQQPMIGLGRFIDGKWYCECELAAKCLTVKKAGPNQGRKCTCSISASLHMIEVKAYKYL